MSFLSIEIFLWLCGAAVVALVLPRRFSPVGVAVVTAGFLAWMAPVSLGILAVTAAVTWFIPGRHARIALILAAIGCIAAILVWFKWRSLSATVGGNDPLAGAVPLGLSYYSFRQIHYLFEQMKQKNPPHHFADYLSYLFFLPTLMVGPINLFTDFHRDMQRRRADAQMASAGFERILYGYVKIIVLGNYVVSFLMAGWIFELRTTDPALAEYWDCFRHAANLYFQFAGYSDIAIGFSLIMGYRVIENFRFPFLAQNISDFWNRWHISLSQFCRNYVFTPVASATRQPYIAIIASMLVLALWHELSLRYVIWGIYHGAGIAVWQIFQRHKHRLPGPKGPVGVFVVRVFSTALTLNFVAISFVFTKEANLSQSLSALLRLLGLEG